MNELKPGRSFELREGLRVVAEGIIERIQYLEHWNRKRKNVQTPVERNGTSDDFN